MVLDLLYNGHPGWSCPVFKLPCFTIEGKTKSIRFVSTCLHISSDLTLLYVNLAVFQNLAYLNDDLL